MREVLYSSPYLSESKMTPEEEAMMMYKQVPRLSQLARREMTKDLMQAYANSLMND